MAMPANCVAAVHTPEFNMSATLPASFDEMLKSAGKPVLVDFWAEWCPPCKALAPTLEQLAREADGRFVVAKVNVDQKPDLAARYGVRSIPTLILFDGEHILWQGVGAMPLAQLRNAVTEAIDGR